MLARVRPACTRRVKVLKAAILLVLRLYKRCISPLLPPSCRFEPTCSTYMYRAIEKNGVFKGTMLGLRRLLKCHPFSAGGLDPAP